MKEKIIDMHSHTNYSDGAGTAQEAFEHASKKAEQVDFMAVTDHSNSFDNADNADISKFYTGRWTMAVLSCDVWNTCSIRSFVGFYIASSKEEKMDLDIA